MERQGIGGRAGRGEEAGLGACGVDRPRGGVGKGLLGRAGLWGPRRVTGGGEPWATGSEESGRLGTAFGECRVAGQGRCVGWGWLCREMRGPCVGKGLLWVSVERGACWGGGSEEKGGMREAGSARKGGSICGTGWAMCGVWGSWEGSTVCSERCWGHPLLGRCVVG